MMAGTQHGIAANIAAALAWWQEAGVDCAFADEPTCWLAENAGEKPATGQPNAPSGTPAQPAALRAPAPEPAKLPPIGGDSEQWPQDLAGFADWWLAEPLLDDGRVAGRVSPRGAAGAPLMVLVEQPGPDDAERLLSGPAGDFLDSMLRAMGVAPESAYVAAVLTRHTPLPDWQQLGERGLGRVLAHHIHLAAPQRLICLGGNILPLLGNDLTQTTAGLHVFNHQGRTIPLLPARGLEAMVRPRARAVFWQRWLDWTGAVSA